MINLLNQAKSMPCHISLSATHIKLNSQYNILWKHHKYHFFAIKTNIVALFSANKRISDEPTEQYSQRLFKSKKSEELNQVGQKTIQKFPQIKQVKENQQLQKKGETKRKRNKQKTKNNQQTGSSMDQTNQSKKQKPSERGPDDNNKLFKKSQIKHSQDSKTQFKRKQLTFQSNQITKEEKAHFNEIKEEKKLTKKSKSKQRKQRRDQSEMGETKEHNKQKEKQSQTSRSKPKKGDTQIGNTTQKRRSQGQLQSQFNLQQRSGRSGQLSMVTSQPLFKPNLDAKGKELERFNDISEHDSSKPPSPGQSITTLKQVLDEAQSAIIPPDIYQFEKNLFHVLEKQNAEHSQDSSPDTKKPLVSFGFRYYLFRFCKYQTHFKQHHSKEWLLKLSLKLIETIKFYCLSENIFPDPQLKYMELFLSNLLPIENTEFFKDIYLEVGTKYFTILKGRSKQSSQQEEFTPSPNTLYMIQKNVERLLFADDAELEDDEALEQDYQDHRTFFTLYLDFFCLQKSSFQTADRIQCVLIAKFLKINHPEFIQFVKETIQIGPQNYSTVEFLIMLGYLVQNKNTPYEYFYRQKGNWLKIIQSAHDFSAKKTRCCIKFLEVFSRERFMHCEKIYHSLVKNIQNNLEAMEGKQLVRILYYYSRSRYGHNASFISSIIQKITRWLPYLSERHFSLLVRSIGNLNYQSEQLVDQLKMVNYERFLCELKYGCENLGPYYQSLVKEVERQAKEKMGVFYQNFSQDILTTTEATSPNIIESGVELNAKLQSVA